MVKIIEGDSTTFAEYLLIPRETKKDCIAENISLKSPLTKYRKKDGPKSAKIILNSPFAAAAMQAVSGPKMAIEMARQGAIAFIYCSQPIEEQKEMVEHVKNKRAGFVKPKSMHPGETVHDAFNRSTEDGFSIYPIIHRDGTVHGFINTNYLKDINMDAKLSEVMRPFTTKTIETVVNETRWDKNISGAELTKIIRSYIPFANSGISSLEAKKIIEKSGSKFLPIIKKDGSLESLLFRKDIYANLNNPNEILDNQNRYICAAAINSHDYKERVPALVDAGVDVLCVDSSDGFGEYVKDCIRYCKNNFPDIPVGGGNIVSGEAFKYLVEEAGADFIKVGIGGGSICITREQKGIGRGQASAVMDVSKTRNSYFDKEGIYIPIISDGGIGNSTQITTAIGMGADLVMCGRMFVGAEESNAPEIHMDNIRYKEYWGEGSNRAQNWQRYGTGKLKFEEGVEGKVPYLGRLKEDVLDKIITKMKSTMSNCGSKNIKELHNNAIMQHVSPQSIEEGKPHDLIMSDNLGTYRKEKWG